MCLLNHLDFQIILLMSLNSGEKFAQCISQMLPWFLPQQIY